MYEEIFVAAVEAALKNPRFSSFEKELKRIKENPQGVFFRPWGAFLFKVEEGDISITIPAGANYGFVSLPDLRIGYYRINWDSLLQVAEFFGEKDLSKKLRVKDWKIWDWSGPRFGEYKLVVPQSLAPIKNRGFVAQKFNMMSDKGLDGPFEPDYFIFDEDEIIWRISTDRPYTFYRAKSIEQSWRDPVLVYKNIKDEGPLY